MYMGQHAVGRDRTHSSQDVEWLSSMVFLFYYTYPRFLTFPVKSVGNLSRYGLFHRLLSFSPLTSWLLLQALLCKCYQLLPQKRGTRNAQFQKRTSTISSGIPALTISTQQEYCSFSERVIFTSKHFKNGSSSTEV